MAVICKTCGLPDDLCACGELDKEEARIVVRLETRRFSKTSTIIEGINPKQSDMPKIVKAFKPAGLEFVWCPGITLEDSEGWRAISTKRYGLLLLRKRE